MNQIMHFEDDPPPMSSGSSTPLAVGSLKTNVISTGSWILDSAIGLGGYPRGHLIEVFGDTNTGKTTLGLHAVASCQFEDGIAAYLDIEGTLDIHYASEIGVDVDALLLCAPACGEDALEIIRQLSVTESADIIVVDSVAALVSRTELGRNTIEDPFAQARMLTQRMRTIRATAATHNTTIIFTNQTRYRRRRQWGDGTCSPGGHSLKFHSTLRVALSKSGMHNGSIETFRALTIKNRFATPFREATIAINWGEGLCVCWELLHLGISIGIIGQDTCQLTFMGYRLGSNETESCSFLRSNPDITSHLYQQIGVYPRLEHLYARIDQQLNRHE